MQHREILTEIALFALDESSVLIYTSLNWDCLGRNRLLRFEILTYMQALNEYRWTLWREAEQQREIDADMDRMFGTPCPIWY